MTQRITAEDARAKLAEAVTEEMKIVDMILDRLDVVIAEAIKERRTFISDALNLVTVKIKSPDHGDTLQTVSTKCPPVVVTAIIENLESRGFTIKHQQTSRSNPPFNPAFDIAWA